MNLKKKKLFLVWENEDSQRNSTFCGESILSSTFQSTSISTYSSDVSFIDDREDSCEESFYANPYCSQSSTPDRKIMHCKKMKRKANVMRIDSDDSDDSSEEFKGKVNIPMTKKRQPARIESDECSESSQSCEGLKSHLSPFPD